MGSFFEHIASVTAWSRRTEGGIASRVPKPGTEGSNDAGSPVNTGEENFRGILSREGSRAGMLLKLANRLLIYLKRSLQTLRYVLPARNAARNDLAG